VSLCEGLWGAMGCLMGLTALYGLLRGFCGLYAVFKLRNFVFKLSIFVFF